MFLSTAPKTAEYVAFTSAYINYRLDHKTNLNSFKRIEITQSMFSDYRGIKL